MNPELEVISNGTRCRNLLSKGMFINHGLPKGKEVTGDGNVWCGRTQTIFGPDDKVCDVDRCTNAARSCFES